MRKYKQALKRATLLEQEIVQTDEVKERLYGVLLELELFLESASCTAVVSSSASAEATVTPTLNVPSPDPPAPITSDPTAQGAKVKHPRISLPRFDRGPVKWATFWDSY